MKKMKKRGISPLLSTVLIIAFVIVLAALTFGWGKSYIDDLTNTAGETEEKILCLQEVSFKISNLCYDSENSTIKIGIDNRGKGDIVGGIFRIKYEDGSADVVMEDSTKIENGKFPISEADLQLFKVMYDKTKNLKEIEFIPKTIFKENKEVTCIESLENEPIYIQC